MSFQKVEYFLMEHVYTYIHANSSEYESLLQAICFQIE